MPKYRVEVPCTLMITVQADNEVDAIMEAERLTFDAHQSGLDLFDDGYARGLSAPLGSKKFLSCLYFAPLDREDTEVNEGE